MNDDQFKETISKIPCCLCGISIYPNPNNMCLDCIKQKPDLITQIPNKVEIIYCRDCGRYQVNQTQWLLAELESPELLQFCLKKIPKSSEIKVINANFIWTEPHSRRIKVSLLYEIENFAGTILHQNIIITYIIKPIQCKSCCELATHRDHWKAIVQIRLHSKTKRTL